MVDFRFDIRPLFPQPIVKVTSSLLPHTFRGDRRQALDATSKMSEIIDRLGQLSAASQKLTIPITTGQRLRQSENQTIYILADTEVEPRGAAIGLLKVGKKDLYLFDETGETRKVESSPCILDFYIHESRQRAGLGKELFETMLAEENWKPIKCSIDRPSEKLIAFMRKHYGLERTIPQANNFVLFEGYFDDLNSGKPNSKQANGLHITNSPNTQLFGATHLGENNRRLRSRQPDVMTQVTQVAPAGRYGARRPVCSMAQKNQSMANLAASKAVGKKIFDLRKSTIKSPLSTSCQSYKPNVDRRSGLQDVDEAYLRQNVFAKPFYRPQSIQDNETTAAASKVEATKQLQKQTETEATNNSIRLRAGANQTRTQDRLQQSSNTLQTNTNEETDETQLSQTQTNEQASKQEPEPASQLKASPKRIQQVYLPVVGKTEMCTTCPNCRATIYLVRGGVNIFPSNQCVEPQATTNIIAKKSNENMIIHQVGDSEKQSSSAHSPALADDDDVASITTDFQQLQANIKQQTFEDNALVDTTDNQADDADSTTSIMGDDIPERYNDARDDENSNNVGDNISKISDSIHSNNIRKPSTFHLSKQHTGMKNISFGVGMAVTPSNKMEFDQEAREDFGVVKINRPVGKLKSPSAPDADAMSTVSSTGEGLTEHGYYDLKFYHNKLW